MTQQNELAAIQRNLSGSAGKVNVLFKYEDGTEIAKLQVVKKGYIPALPAVADDHTRNQWEINDLSQYTGLQSDAIIVRKQFNDKSKSVFAYKNGVMEYTDAVASKSKMLISAALPDALTSIGNEAFAYCSALGSITLPDALTSIGIQAFASCSALGSITLLGITPPTINGQLGISPELPVYVPTEAVDTYKADSSWSGYNIQPIA